MAKRIRRPRRAAPTAAVAADSAGDRELILVTRPEAEAPRGRLMARVARLRPALAERLAVRVVPLFGASEERVRSQMAALPAAIEVPDLAKFYRVEAPDEQLDELAEELREADEVEGAYVKPKGEPPEAAMVAGINDMAPSADEPPTSTPSFANRQIYLNAAPAGVDARYAWRFRGGRGAGVRIIDCEWGWRFGHEDLSQNQGGVVIGSGISNDDHGTAVLGEYSGDPNQFGVVGICSDAHASAASFATLPTASTIRQAADRLRPGDILLLEIHRPGPDASGAGQDGFIAIEWWPDDYAAIRYAVARGIVVVEAAGNGARNLDASIYEQRPIGFPSGWRNPFNPNNPSSGAVLVGAGAPPPGTHGRDHGPDRSRLGFSNFGRRVDVQGWGREVTTCGYGDLQGGSNKDLWYTDQFSGTSSASPIIVGVLGCTQGILRARSRPLLTSERARQVLRSTGSVQQDAPSRPRTQRIGNRPNLREIIPLVLGLSPNEIDASESRDEELQLADHNGRVTINVNTPNVVLNIGTG